jgi:hypothetical protein
VATNNDIEKRLWAAADQLWANSNLKNQTGGEEPGKADSEVLKGTGGG